MGIKSILLFVSMAAISYNQITMVAAEASAAPANSGLEKIKILDDLKKKNCGESTPATKTDCCDQFIAEYIGTDGDNDKITVLCNALKNTANEDFKLCQPETKTAIKNTACNPPTSNQAPVKSEKGAYLKSEFDKLNNTFSIRTKCQKEHQIKLNTMKTDNAIFSHCKDIRNIGIGDNSNKACSGKLKGELIVGVCKLTEKAEVEKKALIENIREVASTPNCTFLVTGAMTSWSDIENICKTVKSTQQADFKVNCPDTYDKVKDAACSLKFESCSGGANAVFSGLLTIFVSLIAALFTKS